MQLTRDEAVASREAAQRWLYEKYKERAEALVATGEAAKRIEEWAEGERPSYQRRIAFIESCHELQAEEPNWFADVVKRIPTSLEVEAVMPPEIVFKLAYLTVGTTEQQHLPAVLLMIEVLRFLARDVMTGRLVTTAATLAQVVCRIFNLAPVERDDLLAIEVASGTASSVGNDDEREIPRRRDRARKSIEVAEEKSVQILCLARAHVEGDSNAMHMLKKYEVSLDGVWPSAIPAEQLQLTRERYGIELDASIPVLLASASIYSRLHDTDDAAERQALERRLAFHQETIATGRDHLTAASQSSRRDSFLRHHTKNKPTD